MRENILNTASLKIVNVLTLHLQYLQEWEEKANKSKEEYNQAMKKYKDSGAADEFKQKKKQAAKEQKAAEKKSKAPPSKKPKTASAGTGSGKFTSKEYIEDDDSSSDSDGDKKKKDSKDVSMP